MNSQAPRVYLDHNATTPLRPEALAAMQALWQGRAGNAASLHLEGRAARAALERARDAVAALAGCDTGEVVFTSGGSEAIATAVRGVCERAPSTRRAVVMPAIEHSAVLESVRLASNMRIAAVPCNREGRIDVDTYLAQLQDDVALAVLQMANNETGVVQPVEEIGRRCRERGIPFLVDAVQAAGKLAIDLRTIHADLLVVSGHKIGGPQGTGALVVRDGIRLPPLIGGGAQELRRRGGTQPVAALAGFGAACDVVMRRRRDETRRLLQLRAFIETRLREQFSDVDIHGEVAPRLANTTNFAVRGVPGETLAIALDLAGFAVSTGSACASGAVEPSHVIRAMGRTDEAAACAIRVSLGWTTRREEAERFATAIPGIVAGVREALAVADADDLR